MENNLNSIVPRKTTCVFVSNTPINDAYLHHEKQETIVEVDNQNENSINKLGETVLNLFCMPGLVIARMETI